MKESNVNGILTRYNQLRPQGGNNLSPRVGYYLIDVVKPSPRQPSFQIAETRWRPDTDGLFTDGTHQTIQLYALQLTAHNPATFNPYELIGSVIHVTSTRIIKSSPEGVERNTLACDWTIFNNGMPKNISDLVRIAGNANANRLVGVDGMDDADGYIDDGLDND